MTVSLYEEYFQINKFETPYQSAGEHLKDYLQVLDMLIDHYLRRKDALLAQPPIYSRGLAVTHNEILNYLEQEVTKRKMDEKDEALSVEVEKCFLQIRSREDKTGTKELPLKLLKQRFSLSGFDIWCVIAAMAPNVSLKYQRLYAYLQDDIALKAPSVGMVYALVSQYETIKEEEIEKYCQQKGMLRFLFQKQEQAEKSVLQTQLFLRKRLVSYLHGYKDNGEVKNRKYLSTEPDFEECCFEQVEQKKLCDAYEKICLGENGESGATLFYLWGRKGAGKTRLLYDFAKKEGVEIIAVNTGALRRMTWNSCEELIDECILETKLTKTYLFLKDFESDKKEDMFWENQLVSYIMRRTDFLFLSSSLENTTLSLADKEFIVIPVSVPAAAERRKIWNTCKEKFPCEESIDFDMFGNQYLFSELRIRKLLSNAEKKRIYNGQEKITRADIVKTILDESALDFGDLATRIQAKYTWDDLEIDESQRKVMMLACNRYKLRARVDEEWKLEQKNAYGNGLSILFYGPPGTGKTMAAQVIANEMGLDLYRVDLSQISSKYVGETEKNLNMVFTEALKSNAILFFDEADSIFAKRTDVKSANDKYSNSETAFILQKMEEYEGITILATNLYQNFDAAFMRRITYSIRFENPDESARLRLWENTLPKEVPVSKNVDFSFFANQFQLSGSNIKSILYSAAYIASCENSDLQAKHIVLAMKYEYQKLGKMLSAVDLGMYSMYLSQG